VLGVIVCKPGGTVVRHRLLVIVALLTTTGLVVSCGSDSDEGGGTATEDQEQTTTTTSSDDGEALEATTIDPCALATVEEVEAAYGVDVAEAVPQENGFAKVCIMVKGGVGASVGVQVARPSGDRWKVPPQEKCTSKEFEVDGHEAVSFRCNEMQLQMVAVVRDVALQVVSANGLEPAPEEELREKGVGLLEKVVARAEKL
jgi:hypothetical protein